MNSTSQATRMSESHETYEP